MNKDIQELLPFYVNGTLSGEDKALVEKAIKNDPSLKDEIAFLKKLRDEVQAQEIENSPGELGLKRLQKAMAEEKLKNDPIARAQSKIAPEQNWRWRAVAIAACLLLVLQTVVTFNMRSGDDLSAAGGAFHFQGGGQIVDVTFAPDAREENIRQLLLSADVSIIDGPSALGVYKLSVTKDADAVIEKLRAHKNLLGSVSYEGSAQ